MKRFELRLPLELHEKIRVEAFKKEISMHQVIMDALEQRYGINTKVKKD